ncbi:hypothetical protein D3C85_1242600 [compost metagenome]
MAAVQAVGQHIGLVDLLAQALAQDVLRLRVQRLQRVAGVVAVGLEEGLAAQPRLFRHHRAAVAVVAPLLVEKVAGQQQHHHQHQPQHAAQL